MLAKAYAKTGQTPDAIQIEKQALELVRQQQDEEAEKYLEANLERFQRESGVGQVR